MTKRTPAKKAAPKNKFSEAKFKAILSDVLDRTTLKDACAQCGVNPKHFWEWLQDEHLNQAYGTYAAYQRCLSLRTAVMAEHCLDIADDSQDDWEVRTNSRTGETYEVTNAEAMARSKLRVDTRLKLMKHWAPGVYSDRPNGGDGGTANITFDAVDQKMLGYA